jgi:hypothetical protein
MSSDAQDMHPGAWAWATYFEQSLSEIAGCVRNVTDSTTVAADGSLVERKAYRVSIENAVQRTAAIFTLKAQWSLYVPPGLTFRNAKSYPHIVVMCFVYSDYFTTQL